MDVHKPSERTRDTLATSGFTQQVGAVLRFVQQQVGGEVIVGLAITNVVLWVLLRPPAVPGTMYVGEILATTAIVLLSCSLVLATRAPLLERFFGGLDRMYLWHRWSAVAAVVLLLPHSVLVTSAPDPNLNELGSVLGQVALIGLVLLLLWALAPRLSRITRRLPTNVQSWFMQYQRWSTAPWWTPSCGAQRSCWGGTWRWRPSGPQPTCIGSCFSASSRGAGSTTI